MKLCDLGLAKYIDEDVEQKLTVTVVTRWYRAPELLLGDKMYTSKIDIWSIGCMWVELLTEGHGPFRGDSDLDTLKIIAQRCQFPDVTSWNKLDFLAQKQWPERGHRNASTELR